MDLFPLLGNASVRARLGRAAADQRLHHCLLFEGPEGVGKARFALQLALSLNCEERDPPPGLFGAPPPPPPAEELFACGRCHSCHLILAGTHPDIVIVRPAADRATPVITAAQAREVLAGLQLQRHSARERVVIVDPVDALTEEAGNALLKTLEEPPPGTRFVLLTSRPAALLQTVRSRSQRVRFGPIAEAELRAWLVERGLPEALAVASGGSPGLALRLSQGEAEERATIAAELCAVVGQPVPRLFAFSEGLAKKVEGGAARATLVLTVLEELLRDAAVSAAGRPDWVLHAAHAELLAGWGRAMWPEGIGRMERAIAAAHDRVRLNVNGRVVLEAVLSTLNLELSQNRARA